MSRRRGQSLTPSLFPFLAVLVCTLGTLILLLALVAQNATETVETKPPAETTKETVANAPEPTPRLTSDTVEALLREEQFRVGQLVAFREQQTEDLEQRRDELTYLEDQMDRLRAELQAISEEVDRATGTAENSEIDETDLAELRRQIKEQQEIVDQLQTEAADQSPRVVIVPHKGPNGTDRRPIYLECHRDGITIWPEGSRLSMAELENAAYSANPLDAALRAIRLHAMKNYGDPVSPYPMLLVRPDGIEAYAAARRAMRDWDDQFGYELVPAAVKLGYGKSDPELKRNVDVAIRTAVSQQTSQRAIASRFGGGGNSKRGVTAPAGRRTSRLPVLSAAQLDQQGRTNGYGSLRESPTTAGNSNRTNSYARATIGSGLNGGAYSSGGQYGNTAASGDEAAATARNWAEQMKRAGREMRQNGNPDATRYGSATTNSNGNPPSRSTTDPNSLTNRGAPNAASESNLGSGSDRYQNPAPNQNLSLNDPSTTNDQRTNNSQRTNNELAMSRGSRDSSNQASTGSGGTATRPPPTSSTGGQAGAMPTTMSQSASMPSKQRSSGAPSQAPPMNRNERTKELVKRQGRDWALPPHLAGMQGGEVVRSLRAECYPDRFILPSSNTGPLEIFGLATEDIDSATLRIATALRDRIDRWGPALPGARWKPRLEVLVHPGGEMRFNQLRALMTDSGIDVFGRSTR
ncbi:MAG: hypothetical protein P8L85_05495 [Rubripirellula sp.]|nr:hypothetical protein [Rubripirellula sp.]